MEPATWIEQATCGLRISDKATSSNPTKQRWAQCNLPLMARSEISKNYSLSAYDGKAYA